MPDVPDPTYISATEVIDQTLIANLKTLDPANINVLIRNAEDQIDNHVGPQRHHPFDSNSDRVFPRVQDYSFSIVSGQRYEYPETPVIPYKVMRATLRQVEFLYLQWWSTSTTAQTPVEKDVSAEEIRGDGGYSAVYTGGGMDLAGASLCHEAKALLNGFVSRWAGISVSHPNDL